ncbi:YobA family protein [Cytobacillus oceanisediminis]|nr:YobA family protein [Cytobacillus oceanisediminis]
MKQISNICTSIALLSFIGFITGCIDKGTPTVTGTSTSTDSKTEGYILKVEENRILVAEDITSEEYKVIKEKSISDLNREGISLIYLSSDEINSLNIGNKVEVLIDGGINESYPAQAKAKKIEVKD